MTYFDEILIVYYKDGMCLASAVQAFDYYHLIQIIVKY